MASRSALILCLSLLLAGGSSADVVLSEVVAENSATGFKAPDGSAYDWIELHNDGAAPVDLSGHYLTDLAGFAKWQFLRSYVIPAGGFRIVFASDRNHLIDGEEHTNFKLNSSAGEYLALLDPDGTSIISEYAPQFPDLEPLVSFGRVSGSNTLGRLASATPGAANVGAAPVVGITSFTASAATIAGGESVTLTWETVNADSVELAAAKPPLPHFGVIATVPVNDSITLSPVQDTTYRIRARNAFGMTEAFVDVKVGPAIAEFTASPQSIATGGKTILQWRVTGSDVTVTVNGGPDLGPELRDLYSPDLPPQAADAVYPVTLTATNPSGTTSATVDLTILGTATPLPPIPPLVISEFFWAYNGTIPIEPYLFFEIHNRGTDPIDLDGIRLFGTAESDLSNASPRVLESGGYGLIINDPAGFAEAWPGPRPVIATFDDPVPVGAYWWSGAQTLVDSYGREIETFMFPQPLEQQSFLAPAYRIDLGAPPTYPDNWAVLTNYDFDGTGSGTPGEAHFEVLSFTATPPGAAPGETVTLNWEVSRDVPLTLSHGIGPVPGPVGSTTFVIPDEATEIQLTLTAETEFDTFVQDLRLILPPNIRSFDIRPRSIVRGESVTLTYLYESRYFSAARVDPHVGQLRSPLTFTPLIGGFPRLNLWRYLPNGNGQGPEWRDVDFDDSRWNYGRGIFGYGNDIEETVLEPGDYITAYFRKEFFVDEVDQVESLSVDLLIDDGAEVYLNGTEVLRELLPEGEIDFDTQPTGVSPNDGRIHRTFPIDASTLVEGTNVIAVGAHNNVRFAEDFGFDLGLLAVKEVPPDGRKTYTFSVSNEAGSASAQVTILIDAPSVDVAEWQAANGLAGDPATTDSDFDNLVDLIEFAAGSDPKAASPPPLAAEIDVDGHLNVQFSQDLAAEGVSVSAQASTDLLTWYSLDREFVFGGSVAPEGSTIAATNYRSYAPVTGQIYLRLVTTTSP